MELGCMYFQFFLFFLNWLRVGHSGCSLYHDAWFVQQKQKVNELKLFSMC